MVGLNNFAETVLTLVSGHRNGKLTVNIFGIDTIILLDIKQIIMVLKLIQFILLKRACNQKFIKLHLERLTCST